MEEEPKVAAIEAKVVEMEAKEVAFQVEEVVGMIMVVVLWGLKTFGQIVALDFPVFVQVESQKQVERELQQHFHGNCWALHLVRLGLKAN